MRQLDHLNEYRRPLMGSMGDEQNGAFSIKIKGEQYTIICSSGEGWEHVSIAHKHKIPSWKTMCILKDMFFHEEEAVMQLHPPASDYVNMHPNCLHLWRPLDQNIPLPPSYMVGIK